MLLRPFDELGTNPQGFTLNKRHECDLCVLSVKFVFLTNAHSIVNFIFNLYNNFNFFPDQLVQCWNKPATEIYKFMFTKSSIDRVEEMLSYNGEPC